MSAVGSPNLISISRQDLFIALRAWEQDARDGKLMTPEDASELTLDEHTERATQGLWRDLGGVEVLS